MEPDEDEDTIGIIFAYDEGMGNIIVGDIGTRISECNKKESEYFNQICKYVFKNSSMKFEKDFQKMLYNYKEIMKEQRDIMVYAYYRQGFRSGANTIKDCLFNKD